MEAASFLLGSVFPLCNPTGCSRGKPKSPLWPLKPWGALAQIAVQVGLQAVGTKVPTCMQCNEPTVLCWVGNIPHSAAMKGRQKSL